MNKIGILSASMVAILMVAGCGQAKKPEAAAAPAASTAAAKPAAPASGLTEWQMTHGIGPVTEPVEIGPLDEELAKQGQAVFEVKCMVCHHVTDRYVGPALQDTIGRRTPEYMMNMMLNPDEMLAKHPEAKKLLGEFLVPMTFQNVTKDEARAIVEYIRSVTGKDPISG